MAPPCSLEAYLFEIRSTKVCKVYNMISYTLWTNYHHEFTTSVTFYGCFLWWARPAERADLKPGFISSISPASLSLILRFILPDPFPWSAAYTSVSPPLPVFKWPQRCSKFLVFSWPLRTISLPPCALRTEVIGTQRAGEPRNKLLAIFLFYPWLCLSLGQFPGSTLELLLKLLL